MRKLTLDLDTIDVQSFATDAEAEALRGTVEGHSMDLCQTGMQPMCPSMFDATDCRVSDLGTCQSCYSACNCTGTCPTNTPECWEDS